MVFLCRATAPPPAHNAHSDHQMSTDPQRADDLFRQALQFKPDVCRAIQHAHQEVMTLPVDGSVFTDPILLEDDRTLMAESWDNDRPRLHVWRAPTWDEIAVEEARKGRRGRPQ